MSYKPMCQCDGSHLLHRPAEPCHAHASQEDMLCDPCRRAKDMPRKWMQMSDEEKAAMLKGTVFESA